MRRLGAYLFGLLLLGGGVVADDNRSLADRTRQYLTDLVRLDTTNPPGNETRAAEYLKQIADSYNIRAELLGGDPKRLNFIARLRGNGKGRPLLLMAHTDVVPAERNQWTVDPFSGEMRNGFIYGRGTLDTKSLLAAEMAVLVEIKRRNITLSRDIILVGEADEEAGSTGIQWLLQHAPAKLDADFALNEGGSELETKDGTKVFEVQTIEKIPTRITLTAKGTAGHGSLPRADNALLHVSQAVVKLAEAEQPIRFNQTTRRYFRDLSKLDDYSWLAPLWPKLDSPATAMSAAAQIRAHDPELDAMLHTTVTPTMSKAGTKINVIPSTAEVSVDVRRMPIESREDILARLQKIINDPAVEVSFAPGQQLPATDPSPLNTPLYRTIERVISNLYPRDSVVVPMMARGATDGSFLRARGMSVYGVPLFLREPGESRVHGNDERISPKSLEDGVELLWQIVVATAGEVNP